MKSDVGVIHYWRLLTEYRLLLVCASKSPTATTKSIDLV